MSVIGPLVLIFLLPLIIRIPHLLVLIPASISFRRSVASKTQGSYLAWTALYLFLGLCISAGIVLLLNGGGPFKDFQWAMIKKQGLLKWLDRSDNRFEFADLQFLQCLFVFYLNAAAYAVSAFLIKKARLPYLFKKYSLNLICAFNFIIIISFVTYVHLPRISYLQSNYWASGEFILAASLIIFALMWALFALPATKNLNSYIKTATAEEKAAEAGNKPLFMRRNFIIAMVAVLSLVGALSFAIQQAYHVSYPNVIWAPDSNRIFYLKSKRLNYDAKVFLCSYDLMSRKHKTIKELSISPFGDAAFDKAEISKDGIMAYIPSFHAYPPKEAVNLMTLDGDLIGDLPVKNISDISWSFDGKKIAYETREVVPESRSEIWVMDKDGANKIKIDGRGWKAHFSPVDYKLVYETKENEAFLIKVVELEKGGVKEIRKWEKRNEIFFESEDGQFFNSIVYEEAGWSPDGQAIIISVDERFYVLELLSDKAKRLNIRKRARTVLSPDLKKILYLVEGYSGGGYVELVDTETGQRELILRAREVR